jgi:septum formation protein
MALILASASAIRTAMLAAAGVPHAVVPAIVDERAACANLAEPDEVALELARLKAREVGARHPDALVIGSDSVVAVDGRRFDKPGSREEAAEHLRSFAGKPMRLVSAVALARGGTIEWSHCETATLHVRPLSEAFIAAYLDAEWPAVGHCVGVFRMEGPGVQLFESIDGDHFTILGMPLLPLLGALRERGAIPG